MRITLATLLVVSLAPWEIVGGADETDPRDLVAAAAKKLAEQPCYTWRTTVESAGVGGSFGGSDGTATGQLEKAGFVRVVSSGGGGLEFAAKGDKAAVVVDGNWMTLDEASRRETGEGRGPGGPPRFDPRTVTEFKLPVAQVEDLLVKATGFKRTEEGVSAEIPDEAARDLLSSGGRGPGGRRGGRGGRGGSVKDPGGAISFAIRDGMLVRLTLSLRGSREVGGNDVKLDRTTTTSFSEVGSTSVAVPPEAKAIVDALLAGKPSPVFVPEPGFKKLFNGRDLTGWAGRSDRWSVDDGAIKGTGGKDGAAAGGHALIARDGDGNLIVDDFELRLSYRISAAEARGPAKPGVRYRGVELPNSTVSGSSVDFEGPPPGGEGVWHDLVVLARGGRRRHFLNGAQTADTVDPVADPAEEPRRNSGVLALQLPADQAVTVQVKNVRWRPLNTPELQGSSALRVAKDFAIELLYTVPRETEGSWVAMCLDPKGRLIVSEQNGGLHRVTLPSAGGGAGSAGGAVGAGGAVLTERIDLDIGGAHGLLWAFDSLYVVVNERNPRGLYRVRDTDGDDRLDKVDLLRELQGGGEHGFHSLVPSPDGKALFLVAGNQTRLTRVDSSRAPLHWGEDDLLPRLPTGFMDDSHAPQGWIASTDPDGKTWELWAMGLRNPFDIAFNKAGELFTYDADMEWDIGDPWYRPTRVNHVVSGAEFGFRNGNGKWPAFAIDSVGTAVDIGPGSPTGIAFGYGAKFPAKWQEALYIADWSFGKLRAVHLRPEGASYTAEIEDFVSGQPFPVTDFLVNPFDGAMVIAVGGRGAQSALYRVTYRGRESTEPAAPDTRLQDRRDLRRRLEGFHGRKDPAAVETVWPYLGDADRAIRFAARVVLEWQDPAEWREKALSEKDARTSIAALVALARSSGRDATHRKDGDPALDAALRGRILLALDAIKWPSLAPGDRLDLLRAYTLAFTRLGPPDDGERRRLAARLDPLFPARFRELNSLLAPLLIFLEAPGAAAKVVAALREAVTQEEQIEYAVALRVLKTGWTPPLREEYFRWFLKAQGYRGGNTFQGSLRRAKENAVAILSEEEKTILKPILDARAERRSPQEILAARPTVKEWTVDDLVPNAERGLKGGRSFERGRRLYGDVACSACHRFAGDGGSVGPDLSGVAGRFGVRDFMEAIVVPSRTISDQYEAVVIRKKNGQIVTGRIGNLSGSSVNVIENMLEPGAMTGVRREEIASIEPSKVSPMPDGLLNSLKEEEIQDLIAYLLSHGDPESAMFR